MKRSGLIERKSRLRYQSEKRRQGQREYREASGLVHLRSGGWCEIREPHDCTGRATPFPHHRKMRSQRGSHNLVNLLDVCEYGHFWIHRVLPRAKAEEYGLLIPSHQPETPYRGER